jgi:hypothetical protein
MSIWSTDSKVRDFLISSLKSCSLGMNRKNGYCYSD